MKRKLLVTTVLLSQITTIGLVASASTNTSTEQNTRDIMEVKPGTPAPQPSAQLSEQNQDVTKTWDRAEVVDDVTTNDVNTRDIMEVKPGTLAPQPSAQLSEQHQSATATIPMEQSQQKLNTLPDAGESQRTNTFLTFFAIILGSLFLFHKKQA